MGRPAPCAPTMVSCEQTRLAKPPQSAILFAYNTMSRIALISDIHANLPALEAVMKDIEQLQCNAVYCLGDVVGYNANPSECLEFIRSRQIPTVRGNHDEEAIGEDNPAGMNPCWLLFFRKNR